MEKNVRKKNKHNKIYLVFITLLCVVLVFQVIILVDVFEKKENSADIALNTVETSIVDLVYNTGAVDSIRARINEDNSVIFMADTEETKEIELFILHFTDEAKGTAVGYIKDKHNKKVKVSLERKSFDAILELNASDKSRLSSAREDLIDAILSNMVFNENISVIDADNYIKVETPYADLMVSKEWEEYLAVKQIEEEPYKVEFYCELPDKDALKLFTYSFGSKGDMLIGYLKEIEVGLSVAVDEPDDSWTAEEKIIFYTMREEMNTIIDHLVNVDGFTLE